LCARQNVKNLAKYPKLTSTPNHEAVEIQSWYSVYK